MLEATKQRYDMFVQHFAANMFRNATQAAILTKYSPKTARAQGCRLLTKDYIKEEIAKAKAMEEGIVARDFAISETFRRHNEHTNSIIDARIEYHHNPNPHHNVFGFDLYQ